MGSNFVYHWPGATFSMHSLKYLQSATKQSDDTSQQEMYKRLDKTTSALHAAANVWTDGVVLPQNTRKVSAENIDCYQLSDYSAMPISELLNLAS